MEGQIFVEGSSDAMDRNNSSVWSRLWINTWYLLPKLHHIILIKQLIQSKCVPNN